MRKVLLGTAAILFAGLFIVACSKSAKEVKADAVSDEILSLIAYQGLSTDNVKAMNGGYLVEGDIFLSADQLKSVPGGANMTIASEEQYRTFNLVTVNGTRTVNVYLELADPNAGTYFGPALDEAIKRYNDLSLTLKFARVTTPPGTGGMTVKAYYENSNTIGFGGFPSGGNPYNLISLNTKYFTASANTNWLATVIAHEMGHCIGFRHTDYMRRAYSCGSGGNEGQAKNGVGAVLIPGTPSGPDALSWMLACSDGSNRPFNVNDITALNFLY
jgi:hypothetical protein